MKLSKKYSLQDITRSDTATRLNMAEQFNPPNEVIDAAALLCNKILDGIPYPFFISSFYRCPALNKKVGGSSTSDHMKGQSADLDSQNNSQNKLVFDWIKEHCEFDQLIWEFGTDAAPDWVHVSYRKNLNRNQILKAIKVNGVTKYIAYK